MGFAVVDVETTGFAAGRDRVIEIAVVQLDAQGAITGEWCTLVNPRRDLGPQHIHRITTREVLPAPTFEQITGDLVTRLAGRVLVAHNLTFDARFLNAELTAAGVLPPPEALDGLCTMTLAPRYLTTDRRNLAACCAAAGIPLTNAHSALHDARATAALLAHYLAAGHDDWSPHLEAARSRPWPFIPALDTPVVHRSPPGQPVARRPRRDGDPTYRRTTRNTAAYRTNPAPGSATAPAQHGAAAAPDPAAPFPRSSSPQTRPPFSAANHHSPADTRSSVAPRSPAEHHSAAVPNPPASGYPTDAELPAGFRLDPGDRIAFTGQTDQPREQLQAHAAAAGLVTHPENVCRWTKVVVAADPDSLSTKARKARDYQIPIITEPVFARLLAELRTPG
ncbi:exonuclease domain-containing protein [Crossiella cryophila]|uniref:DNA polymerase-3 subunit epsilon n=1 Tax=Crossiella cryophila TaxID=43355 RepID=A0A7W7CDC8_9PSEU|nr:exonuclease domain-containing protein [Crossiella cryophila]MBB4679061.1 DNA polymerase-3 subunit epsilon [Crossiella cryophila]